MDMVVDVGRLCFCARQTDGRWAATKYNWAKRPVMLGRVQGVAVALVGGLDSCDSPSALSVPACRARIPVAERLSRVESPLCCSELYAFLLKPVAAG